MDRGAELEGRRRTSLGTPLAWAAAVLALVLTGCGKDDKIVAGDPPSAQYLAPTSPQSVLKNMVLAYEDRDSVATSAVYDLGYQGTSTDLVNPARPVYNFSWFDEKHHVAALAMNPNIVSISVDFGPQATWLRLPPDVGDPQDWAVIQVDGANIQINDADTGFLHQAQNAKMLYTFIPTVHAPGDTTWKIIRWTEVRI